MSRFLMLMALVGFLCGCTPDAPVAPKTTTQSNIDVVSVTPTPTPSTAPFRLVTYTQLDQEIKAEKGQVVLVDVWSTGCPTCIKKMPSIVKIAEELKARGLVVLGVNTDEPEDTPKAQEILTKFKVSFRTLQFKDNEDEEKKWEAIYPLSPQPQVWIYNRKGERVNDTAHRLAEPDLRAALEKLLADGA
jgi:thiol-disulfide isomerase/thioredoxin